MTIAGGRRIVLTTFGSLGDLHPYIAIALGLKRRGHRPVIATLGMYRETVESLGIEFRVLRAASLDRPDAALMKQAMHPRRGTEFVIRELLMPHLRQAYADTDAAAEGADLLISHPMTYTTPLVAEKRRIPWASTMLMPMGFFSAYDPPVVPRPLVNHLRVLGPTFLKPALRFVKWTVNPWGKPWHQLRTELGLPPGGNPFFEGMVSPGLALALFSKLLGARQPDWPARVEITGFPLYDGGGGLTATLATFLDAGPPPVVFTLGSSAVMDPGRFYEESARAARELGRRAVLLTGSDPATRPSTLPEGVLAVDYAPFSELFPRAAAVVHQGGVGTTAQAMRSGKPMLVVPFAHDQPDNAERVGKLGIARTLARHRYTAARAAAELDRLLSEPVYAARAAVVGDEVRGEDGVTAACVAIEKFSGG